MNNNLAKEMQELLKRVEKFEVVEKDSTISLELEQRYTNMDNKIMEAVKVREANEKLIVKLTEDIERFKQLSVSEADEDKRREFYNQMRKAIDEKEFLAMNSQFRLTPVLVKESREIEASGEYKTAHEREYGKFANEGIKLQKELKELYKKIDEAIERETKAHPFNEVMRQAAKYSSKG